MAYFYMTLLIFREDFQFQTLFQIFLLKTMILKLKHFENCLLFEFNIDFTQGFIYLILIV
jgi:hypothetical protein